MNNVTYIKKGRKINNRKLTISSICEKGKSQDKMSNQAMNRRQYSPRSGKLKAQFEKRKCGKYFLCSLNLNFIFSHLLNLCFDFLSSTFLFFLIGVSISATRDSFGLRLFLFPFIPVQKGMINYYFASDLSFENGSQGALLMIHLKKKKTNSISNF